MHKIFRSARSGARRGAARALATLLASIALTAANGATPPSKAGVGPTVQEVIEFARMVRLSPYDHESLRISPNGRRAFVVTRKGELGTDRTLYDVLLFELDPERLSRGERPPQRSILKVHGSADNHFLRPFVQEAYWADDRTIIMKARIDNAPHQVHRLDVDTGTLTQLTFATNGVETYVVSKDLSRVVYLTLVPNPPMRPGERSVVVGSQSFWSVMWGQTDVGAQIRRYQYMSAVAGSHEPAVKLGGLVGEVTSFFPPMSVSPDGRWAVLPRYEPDHQLRWMADYPKVHETGSKSSPAITSDPLRYYSRAFTWIARRHIVYRLSDGSEKPVLDAPDDAVPLTGPVRTDRLWSRDGRSVILLGTHLPRAKPDARPDARSHIVEYWPETGRWTSIGILEDRLQEAYALQGREEGFIAIDGKRRRAFVRGDQQAWREVEEPKDGCAVVTTSQACAAGGWKLRVEQGLNQPADVMAHGPKGEVVRVTDLNPRFSADTWGRMEPYEWKDAKGRTWPGGLMVPADYDRTKAYPLVIQTYGFNPGRFYLDGSNRVDGATSGFPGRAFLREGMLVLAFPIHREGGYHGNEREDLDDYLGSLELAIASLVDRGIVDRDRIGIIGWSASGDRVYNAVTFSKAPLKAASLIDANASTLMSYTILYGYSDGQIVRLEDRHQGAPFGVGRDAWIRNDPSLSTDCIRAAMRIETYTRVVAGHWDTYALLRRQYKAVEKIRIPTGAHSLARPVERMISLQGNVDWYRFWLKGEERREVLIPGETDASLEAQYVRWREMAKLKEIDDAKPRCGGRLTARQ